MVGVVVVRGSVGGKEGEIRKEDLITKQIFFKPTNEMHRQ